MFARGIAHLLDLREYFLFYVNGFSSRYRKIFELDNLIFFVHVEDFENVLQFFYCIKINIRMINMNQWRKCI